MNSAVGYRQPGCVTYDQRRAEVSTRYRYVRAAVVHITLTALCVILLPVAVLFWLIFDS